jgi:signal transduction histidine kinase
MADRFDLTDVSPAVSPDVAAFRNLCHDLRQPLVVALGYVSMLEDGSFGELSAEVLGVLGTISGRLDVINAMVDAGLESADNGTSSEA